MTTAVAENPKKKTRKTMTVSLSEDTIAALNALAEDKMLPRSRLVEMAVAELLKKAQKQAVLDF